MAEQQPEVKIIVKKKKGGHAAAHGGAWKVAYADLVTALMAFFLLMWLLSSASASTKAAISKHFSEGPEFWDSKEGKEMIETYNKGILPGGRGMSPMSGDGEGSQGADADTLEKERKAMEETATAIENAFRDDKLLQAFQDQLSMDFTDEGLRIQIQDKAAQVLFDSGSSRLKPYTLSILKEIAQELGKLPNHVVIGGHTDAMPYAGQAYTNWELSSERAGAARRVLESFGLKPGQVRRVTGYAETIPLEGKDPKDPQNRRISIVVLSSETDRAELQRQKSRGNRKQNAQEGAKEGP